jgi:2-methylcitrate dehydratase PrpD
VGERRADRDLDDALHRLGRFVEKLDYQSLPARVRERTLLVVTDLIGVTVAGARTSELRALLAAWAPPPGPAPVLGGGVTTDADASAWLNGTAACALELDEGNKHAQGHPAAHVVFAAIATASCADRAITGRDLLSAVEAGYEVAARFGRATRRHGDLHTHGHWGATGAGAAAGRLSGLPAEGIAAAIDTATGLVFVTPWSVVLAGSFVRNLWAAGSNVAGLMGARLALAGLSQADGTAGRTLGGVVGTLDVGPLNDRLGQRWDITHGYFKRHASCSYTHPAADAVLALRERHGFTAPEVARIVVHTHRLTMPLARISTHSRIAAMFSLPYVLAVAARHGTVGPEVFSAAYRSDPRTLALAERVEVVHDESLDDRLPAERAARVTVELVDGRTVCAEQPNPVGDADYLPFDTARVRAKVAALVGEDTARRIETTVAGLAEAADVRPLLARLR